ncbi:MAG: hypothetical protein NXY57DRAFT_970093 [Lentinula lateritia]|nr:MAG: hypothetical protein NXY57DRAFT_970093 [Lentinula lateritia]
MSGSWDRGTTGASRSLTTVPTLALVISQYSIMGSGCLTPALGVLSYLLSYLKYHQSLGHK